MQSARYALMATDEPNSCLLMHAQRSMHMTMPVYSPRGVTLHHIAAAGRVRQPACRGLQHVSRTLKWWPLCLKRWKPC